MIKFFEEPSKWILGCDPGPEHSAFALLKCDDATRKPSVEAVSYVSNANVAATSCESMWSHLTDYGSGGSFAPIRGSDITYAFERCAVQAGGANAMVRDVHGRRGAEVHGRQQPALPDALVHAKRMEVRTCRKGLCE